MRRNTRIRRGRRGGRVIGRSRSDSDWLIRRIDVSDAPIGPDMVTPGLEEVMRAIENAPRGDDWGAVRRIVIPVLPRVRREPPGYPESLTTVLPPGVVVGFGADIGPAFMRMNAPQLEILGISQAELVAESLANLLSRAETLGPEMILHGDILDTPIRLLQSGVSIASTLILVPDQLERILGPSPALLVAPMRDLLIAFPSDVAIDLAAWVFDEFASQDPNCLTPIAYRFDGHTVTTAALGALSPLASVASRRFA